MRRLWQKPAHIALIAGGAIALLVSGAILVFISPLGRNLMASTLVHAIAGQDGTARYDSLSGDWPSNLAVSKLSIADRDGPWLTVDRAMLEWRPWALLGGTLRVTKLTLEKPVLLRQPKAPASEPSGGLPGRPPVALRLDSLTISDALIKGEAPIRFDGRAAARWTRKEIFLNAVLQRREGPDEHLRLTAGLNQDTKRVSLNADLRALPGGLFAQLAGMPDLPALRVEASGAGPAEAWLFKAKGAGGDYGSFNLAGKLAWSRDIVLDLQGTLEPGRALGETLVAAVGEKLRLGAHATRANGAGSVRLALNGKAVEAELDARVDAVRLLEGRRLQGKFSLTASKPIAFGGTAAGPGEIGGTLRGTLERPGAALSMALESMQYGRYALAKFSGSAEITTEPGGAIALGGKGGVGSFAYRGETVVEEAGWSLRGKQDGDEIRDAEFTLTSAPLVLEAKGGLDQQSGSAHLNAKVTAQDLKAISPIARVRLAGQADLALTYRRGKSDQPAPITLTGKIANGAVAGQPLKPFVGEALNIEAALTQHPDGTLTMEKGVLAGDHLNASMSGRVEPALDMPIALDTDLSALGALAGLSASGKAAGKLVARGTLDDPRLTLTLTSREAAIEGRSIGVLTIGFQPHETMPIPAGLLILKADGPPGGMDLSLPVSEDQGLLVLGAIGGAAYGARLSGMLRETPDGIAGKVDAKIADLSGIYSLATGTVQPVAGRGTAALVLGPANDRALVLSLRDVMREDRQLAAAKLALDASRKANTARLAMTGQELRLPGPAGPVDARRLTLQGSGPMDRFDWTLTGEGVTSPQGTIESSGTFASRAQGSELALAALSGTLWGTAVALEAPARLSMQDNRTALSPLAFNVGHGRLQLTYSSQDAGRKAQLALSALPISFIGRMIGADWPQGRITSQAGLDTIAARPSGFADIQFSGALFSRIGKTIAEPLAGVMTARWDGRALNIKGRADRLSTVGTPSEQPIRLEARLPLIRKRNGAMGFDPNGAVSGEAHWTGRLSALWAILPYDLHRLDGNAVMNGRASGRWRAPQVEGTLQVESGSYESLMTGTRLTGIALRIDAHSAGGDATIQGGDGRGGRFEGRGHLSFGEGAAIEADINLSRLRIAGLDRLTAEASGPLALRGGLKAPKLTGKLRIDRLDATIPDRLPPSIPQLPVRYVDETDVTIPQFHGPETERNAALALRLDVDIPGQAFLRGRGLTSEWRGAVSVEGTSLEPRIGGHVELVKGQIAFAGRSYELTRGRVNFDGSTNIDPMLDVAATRSVQGTEIALALSGPSSAPRLDLTSSPALPRDQAMSLFLFGKPAQSLTTLELLDVARSVASLTGTTGGGFDPIEKTRRALGLDILTLGVGSGNGAAGTASDLASSATIEAGRYVSKRVYLGVKQGARPGSSAVQLNYALTPHLSAGTEAGVESGGQVNLNWKWDY